MASNTASTQPPLKAGDRLASMEHSEAHYFNRFASFLPHNGLETNHVGLAIIIMVGRATSTVEILY